MAQEAQIPLTVQKDRSGALIKNPPVVKDAPPGSIPPDSIIPAIRLINGDVIHGWIKEDGTAATHPEIAKQYGVTVEELDRKGWISKDGKAFYEREPAAVGTQLPTAKKEGELHSTDKPKEVPPAEPSKKGIKNPHTAELIKARSAVQVLEKAVAKDPSLQPTLDKARAELAEAQKKFDLIQKQAPPAAPTEGAPPEAPSAVKAKPGVAAPGEPAISEAKPEVEKGQGPAEQAWRAHDEEIRLKLHNGGELNREDRLKNRELWKAALAENPELGVEGSGLTMKFSGEETDPEEMAKIIGFTYNPSKQSGGVSLEGMPPEFVAQMQKAGLGETWEFTDRRPGSETAGYTFYVPKGSSMQEVIRHMDEGRVARGLPPYGRGGAGVTMKGRHVPPYDEKEALEISKGIFPDKSPASLTAMVKAITTMDPSQQDLFVNHLRLESERLRQEAIQKRIESGTEKRLPLSPGTIASLKLGIHQYISSYVEKVVPLLETGALTPTKVTQTGEGKTKIKLPTVEPLPGGEAKPPVKIRYAVPDPVDWLNNTVRNPPVGLGITSPPEIVQASDRQLLQIYDEYWENYLSNAPSKDLEALRTAHRLDRLDLRGIIPEPELDQLLRILQNVKHGNILPEKIEAMAKTAGIDTTQENWRQQYLDNLRERIRARLPDIALAKGIDITEPGWDKKLFRGLLTQEKAVGKARAEYTDVAKTKGQIIKLVREFNDATQAMQNKRSRLVRTLMQRGSSEMFVARKSTERSRITTDDIEIKEGHSDVGPYSQFILIKDIDSNALDYLAHGTKIGEKVEHVYTPDDLDDLNVALVEGNGGVGADATKRITLLYNTETEDLEAVSTYKNDRTGKAMIYDPTGEPGRRDRDHLRITKLPGKYRIFGTMLVRDPVGYFHQRWASDESGSGLKKFWLEIGEVANGAAEGDRGWQRITKVRAARKEKEARKKLLSRMELTPEEQRAKSQLEESELEGIAKRDAEAQDEIDRLEQEELNGAHDATGQTLQAEGKKQKDPDEFSVKQLSDFSNRLARVLEFSQSEEPAGSARKAVSRNDQAAMDAFEEHSRRGLVEQAKAQLFAHDISHQEARELAYLFYRFNIDTTSRESFARSMGDMGRKKVREGTVLGYINATLKQEIRGRNMYLLSAIKKIAAVKYKQLLGRGTEQELKWFIEDHPTLSKEAAVNEFHKDKQLTAFEYALEEIRDIHVSTKAELDQLPRRAQRVEKSQTTPDFPLYPDRFAHRVTEAFGDVSARYINALSESSKHATGRELTAPEPGKIAGGKMPEPVVTEPTERHPFPERFTRGETTVPNSTGRTEDRSPYTHKFDFPEMGTDVRDPESGKAKYFAAGPAEGPPSYTRTEGPGAGLTMKEHVAGRQRRDEQAEALGLPPTTKPDDSKTMEELLEMGPKAFAQGGLNSNPYQVMERVTRTGQISTKDASLLLWHDRQLQQDADRLANDPNFGKDSPEYKAAEKDWLEWRDLEQNASGGTASELMRVRQGVQDLDTGSWTAMKSELHRATGGKATPEDESILEGLVGEQHETDEAIVKAESKVKDYKAEDILTMGVTPEQKAVIDKGADEIDDFLKIAGGTWKRDENIPMAMKGGKVDPLTPIERDGLIARGIQEMIPLSRENGLSEESWRRAMVKKYPNSAPFLSEIWAPAQKLRDTLVSRAVSMDKNTAIARRVLTRNLPTPEESKAVLVRAVQKNPGMKNISTAEAIHAWNFIKQKYFDKMDSTVKEGSFDAVLTKAAMDLGIDRERLYHTLVAKKSIRVITDEMYRLMNKSNRLRSYIRNWIDKKENPWLVNVAKSIPGYFFMDKILGHGFVGMITHANSLIFQPWAWKNYFGRGGGWDTMYRMGFDKAFHARMMKGIETDSLYRFAKRSGVECDPNRRQGDYEILHSRAFDALKKLRLDLFKTWWGTLKPEHQTDAMGKLIANDVNHLTGIVHTRFPQWANWTFFAPKLATAQLGVLIGDPVKAMGYMSHWRTSTPAQMAWARGELMHKAAFVGVYALGLVANEALLAMGGHKQEINWDDPKKSDFLSFKVGGFNVGVAGPTIQIVRLFSDMIHIGLGEKSKLEQTQTRQARMGERLWEYGRRKMSPFASAAVDTVTGQDFTGRPLPWSSDVLPRGRRLRGESNYEPLEYALQTVAPIPVEEAVKEIWSQMGMDTSTMTRLWRALAVSVPMALTGGRVWEDPHAESEPESVKGPVSAY